MPVPALSPNLIRSTIVSPGTSSNWTDNTVYGGSNPARNTVAVALTAYKMSNLQVATAIGVTAYNPATATTFVTAQQTGTVTINGVSSTAVTDGWYQYRFVIAPNYTSTSGTNNQYDIVFDSIGGVNFYQYINAASTSAQSQPLSNPAYWIVIGDPTTVIANLGTSTQTNNIAYQVVNKIVDFQSSIYYLQAQSAYAQTYSFPSAGRAQVIDAELGDYTIRVRNLFSSLSLNEALGKNIDGENNAQLLARYAITYSNITTKG